ncbi:Relaxase/Mobilisation nuclease domain-containing protein [Rhodobacter sp. 24-YEA-8]|nr:Relaxase/Mobilisation nuclease domain-containing protein [Rhodobacter sp. 24-YEA-8]
MRHLSSDDPEAAASEMQTAASVSVRTQQPVMHIVVSYDPADAEPSNADMRQDAAGVLRGLGLAENQAIVVRHHDRDHAHMHLMVNRVGADGKSVSDSNSFARAEAALRRIEARRGLTVTPGRHAPAPDTGRRMRGDRATPDPRQHNAPDGVRRTLLTAGSWKDLHSGLATQGWRAETVQRGRGQGLILIGPDGQRIGAGQIDRAATLSRIRQRLDPRPVQTAAPTPAGGRPRVTQQAPVSPGRWYPPPWRNRWANYRPKESAEAARWMGAARRRCKSVFN